MVDDFVVADARRGVVPGDLWNVCWSILTLSVTFSGLFDLLWTCCKVFLFGMSK